MPLGIHTSWDDSLDIFLDHWPFLFTATGSIVPVPPCWIGNSGSLHEKKLAVLLVFPVSVFVWLSSIERAHVLFVFLPGATENCASIAHFAHLGEPVLLCHNPSGLHDSPLGLNRLAVSTQDEVLPVLFCLAVSRSWAAISCFFLAAVIGSSYKNGRAIFLMFQCKQFFNVGT